jgi:hypothetical protein
MSRVLRMTAVRHAILGSALAPAGLLAALAISSIANAGDLNAPVYSPYPQVAPDYGRVYEHPGPCRIVLQRRVDPYGREIVHRMRVCDEGSVYSAPGETMAPQEYGYPQYGYPPQRYYEPVPSGYDPYAPRPPALVGPRYYN